MQKKLLIIDRDGTLIKEAPPDYRIDRWSKLEFYPHVFEFLRKIYKELSFELIMASNQDGLGRPEFPEESFRPIQDFIIKCFENEGIHFESVLFDYSYPDEHVDTRKPGTGMFRPYLNDPSYNLTASFVIGDRITDVQLAKNLGCKAIWLNNGSMLGVAELSDSLDDLRPFIALETTEWEKIYGFLKQHERAASYSNEN